MVRVTLKQILPLAFVFATTVIAQHDYPTITLVARADNSKDDDDNTSSAAPTKANKKEDSTETEESEATSTSKDDEDKDDKDSKDGKDDKDSKDDEDSETKTQDEKSATETKKAEVTDNWKPKAQATLAPDLNASANPLRDPGFLSLSAAFGLLTLGMAML